ncbi:MAG: NAD(P)H-hydrate dehydratase [Clostridia bacterium]|nr:NAD(P)H-hydrate dehydratase [Clostridia bacterium]
MIRVCMTEDIRLNERETMEEGVDVYTLIDRASSSLHSRLPDGKVLVVVGKGKNGADGLSLAIRLQGARLVKVYSLYDDLCEEGSRYMEKYVGSGGEIVQDIDEALMWADVVVDSIFGIGLSREVSSDVASVISKINASGRYVLSADIPSGLNADNGKVMGACVEADLTVSFSPVKAGYLLNDGKDYVGEVVYADVGIDSEHYTASLYSEEDSIVPARRQNTHKGDYGRVYVIAGSPCYVGASLLATASTSACLRSGAGLVTLCVPYSMRDVYQSRVLEETLAFLPDDNGKIIFDQRVFDDIKSKADCIVIGMGLGANEYLVDIVRYLVSTYSGKLVLDADALNCLEGEIGVFDRKAGDIVLTPHPKEFGRISGVETRDINPIYHARTYARENGVTVLLKGATTVVAYPDERVYLVANGGPHLAKGGSGDVLAGMVAGSIVQGHSVERAVYLHALAGRRALADFREAGVVASELIRYINRQDF